MNSGSSNICVLFADISGSSRLYEKLGDAEALHTVERCLKRMERAATASNGRVVKAMGDELMVEFDSADAAVHAAVEIQQRVDALPPVSGVALAVRVGLHYGPVIVENDDIFGDTVNMASRLADMANAGQVLTSAATVALLPAELRERTRALDAIAVKGKDDEIEVVEVLWARGDEDLTLKFSAAAAAPRDTRLHLRYGDQEITLDTQHPDAAFGRDPHADIVTHDSRASRSHGRIERRRDKYVLIDQSTNGTYVKFLGETEFSLRREEAVLRSRGYISFGHSSDGAVGEVLEFEVLG
jgi:class 3 adenylate cyclase